MTPLRGSLAAVVALALFFLAAAPAGASTVFGSALLGQPDRAICEPEAPEPQLCTYAIGALPQASWAAGGPVAPSAGVITSWAVKAGPAKGPIARVLRLRVLRGNASVETGYPEPLPPAGGISRFTAQVPIRAGDRLGLDVFGDQPGVGLAVASTTVGASSDHWAPPLGSGERAPDGSEPDSELLLQATIEPDVDGDGLGDETQDPCPYVSLRLGCPPVSMYIPPEPPDTWVALDVSPQRKIHRTKASFYFGSDRSSATFRCKLGRKPWKACKSPTTYRGLKRGWHLFRVRAVDGSAVDPTPAKLFFKVVL